MIDVQQLVERSLEWSSRCCSRYSSLFRIDVFSWQCWICFSHCSHPLSDYNNWRRLPILPQNHQHIFFLAFMDEIYDSWEHNGKVYLAGGFNKPGVDWSCHDWVPINTVYEHILNQSNLMQYLILLEYFLILFLLLKIVSKLRQLLILYLVIETLIYLDPTNQAVEVLFAQF